MTYQAEFALPEELLKQITANRFVHLPELIRIVINAAMQAQRQQHPVAAPYQRTPVRCGHANGFKPKSIKINLGEIPTERSPSRRRRLLPRSTGREAVKLMSTHPDHGGDVHPGRFHLKSDSHGRVALWS